MFWAILDLTSAPSSLVTPRNETFAICICGTHKRLQDQNWWPNRDSLVEKSCDFSTTIVLLRVPILKMLTLTSISSTLYFLLWRQLRIRARRATSPSPTCTVQNDISSIRTLIPKRVRVIRLALSLNEAMLRAQLWVSEVEQES